MTITKIIEVVDIHGNTLKATYPKRARGLVKNGRARYLTDTKIELFDKAQAVITAVEHTESQIVEMNTRPSLEFIIDLEDTIMSENTCKNAEITAEILKRIDTILADSSHIQNALANLQSIPAPTGSAPHPIASIVMARETTNQKLIELLEKMYDDVRFPRLRRRIFETVEAQDEDGNMQERSTLFGVEINKEKIGEFSRDVENFVKNWAATARDAAIAARDSVRSSRAAANDDFDDEDDDDAE